MECNEENEARESLVAVDPPASWGTRLVSGARLAADKEKIAQFCAREIRREARRLSEEVAPHSVSVPDDKPLNALELHHAAVAMTLRMVSVMERDSEREAATGPLPDGAYIPEEEAAGLVATLFLRHGLGKMRRRRVMKHEMSHHLQRTRVALAVYDAETVTCEENDINGFQVRHEIAARTEDLV